MNRLERSIRAIARLIGGFCAFVVICILLIIWGDPIPDEGDMS